MLLGSGKLDPEDISKVFAEIYVEEMLNNEAQMIKIELLVDEGRDGTMKTLMKPISALIQRTLAYLPEETAQILKNKKMLHIKNISTKDTAEGRKKIMLEIESYGFLQERQARNILREFGEVH